ncbi:MAG: dehydrogenase [Candidatus Nephthysia bennettiae]|uniref:Gfo/Idh/MocA family oxidoreductase n=1 Tax=Candidatus Nephthysia bennettiae TaxID=3127016 RepID=A0A934K9K9_9BACT|nr:Gfo/Idh/MocA family oxidoreductase [Candidatus Dormibacteraeota bacterium]MBJ7614629.1 Gfo/Idh/MocA family oxidoreductase [Candidatus Dormibacteraeota bacterium]PZR92453.1 MAG: dehydrogenase [Candidatus Dormibacteraeota bacterium]
MENGSIGVAVIGAGMAGRAHAAGYRSATTVFGAERPEVRLVAVADIDAGVAEAVRHRYGFERAERSWQAIAEAKDIDAVSVVVANHLHREVVEGLLAAGKHVLCEKPLAPSVGDAEAMVAAAERSSQVTAVGYTYRRSPAVSAIRDEVKSGRLGDLIHFNGHAWYDYALDPLVPMTWRYRGGPGSGVLADVGSHLVDLAEYVCGPVLEVSGALFATVIAERPVPVGTTAGHGRAELSGEMAAVENEDIAVFTVRFASGALGTFSTSRVAHGNPDGLAFELFSANGSAAFDLQRAAEFVISDSLPPAKSNGHRRVFIGPEHPYIHLGLPVDAPGGVGHGTADMFVYQTRAFLNQVAKIDELPPCASFSEGLHGLEVLEAVAASASRQGATVQVA